MATPTRPCPSQAHESHSTNGPDSGFCPHAACTSKNAIGSPLMKPTTTGQAMEETPVATSITAAEMRWPRSGTTPAARSSRQRSTRWAIAAQAIAGAAARVKPSASVSTATHA